MLTLPPPALNKNKALLRLLKFSFQFNVLVSTELES